MAFNRLKMNVNYLINEIMGVAWIYGWESRLQSSLVIVSVVYLGIIMSLP